MIRTARLVLRPFAAGDLDALHAIFSDPRAMRHWDRPAWDDIDRTRRLLAEYRRDAPDEHIEYAVDRDGTLIGRVAMWKRYEVGYIFAPDHWGRGYATEAMEALIPEILARFPEAQTLTAELDPRNEASVRLLRRLGFVQTGLAERNFHYGDEWTDTAYFALQRPSMP